MRQTSGGVYGEAATQWAPWLRSIVGLRADRFEFKVGSSIAANSGSKSASIASPKLSLIFGPWNKTEFFSNTGYGFHSNDARGTVATVATKDPNGPAINPVDPLVRSKGFDLGTRTEIVPGLQSSLALWALKLDSELLFVGDAGETEPSRASKRYGVEWNNHYVATPWLLLDADLSASRSRFTEPDPADPTLGTTSPARSRTWCRWARPSSTGARGSASSSCATSARARWSKTTASARKPRRSLTCASATRSTRT